LRYNLMTQYTSFVAIDSIVRRNANGELVTVQQAQPLPEGVENTAVGAMAPMLYGSAVARPTAMPMVGRLYNGITPPPAADAAVWSAEANADSSMVVMSGPLADSISIVSLTGVRAGFSAARLLERVNSQLRALLPAQPSGVSGPGQKITLDLTIGRDGSVTAVRQVSSELDAVTAASLLRAIRSWQFAGLTLRQPLTLTMTLEVW
ncbi:MAG TPA: hypothetical protein PKM88_16415, partial [bacterium]|nr:hypothetical protein [bacterium]